MNRHRTIICVLAFFVVLFIPLLAQAAPEAKQAAPLGIHSEVMNPEGEYVVSVLKEGQWKEAGKLSFDKYFRQKEMDLSKYITGDGNVKIRLVEKGGGAAHIDAVLLGERPPVEVKGTDDVLALKKVSKKDFDVVDAFEKSMEFRFPDGSGKVLSLTARVEGTRISDTPFHFPLSNLYKDMNVNSEFYHYRLAENPGENETPFFKEYCVTGSGHPSGYTYGWVSNDNQNLYVRMDFTPDDTMDGDKDYAKVYVKTEEGIREFRESVPETKWGNPDFSYTDKVEYQHKVYDFTIPLKDVGVKDIEEGKELLLAFAAYGTATPIVPHIGVTKAVTCAPSSGICDDSLTYSPSASGVQGASCPNFCYKIQVSNDGGEGLTNVTINDPDLPGLTIPSTLAIGQSVTLFASKTWCTAGSPHVNTVTASGQGSSSGNGVSSTDTASVTAGSLGLDFSITLSSNFDLDGVQNNHVTLPAGATNVPVDVTLTIHNSGLGDQNVDVTLPGLWNCLDLTTPITIPSPLVFLATGTTTTIDMGCLLVSCPAGLNLTVPAVGSAVMSTPIPCVFDNTGNFVTVTTAAGGQVSCQSSPAIATSATNASGASTTISDSATLSGGNNPTGSITFKLYGPSATASCTNLVFTSSPVTVNGNGTYGPVSFSPAVTGNYYWIASYSGDANNSAVSGACGDSGETSTVSPGLAKVVKTVSGQPPTGTQAFTFQLRQGASTTSDGTTLEQVDANSTDSWTISFTTQLVPGQHYQLCEVVLPFWDTDLTGDGPLFVPNSIIPPSLPNQNVNNETVCTDFTATSGQTRTFTVNNVNTCGIVTDSSLCPFDVDNMPGDQFRLVLTPDQNNPLTWKLNASNPGQFYYNVFYFGLGSTTLNITLPYPFVTQGAVPIHIYDSVAMESVDGETCFTPGTEIANYSTQVTLVNYSPQQFGSTATIAVDVPSLTGDFAYINIHLDYGLKSTTGWTKGGTSGIDAISKRATPLPTIKNLQSYTFSDPAGCDVTIQSENAFKRDPGIGGLVLADGTEDPAPNAEVLIYDSGNRLLATVYTDKDGWYMWQYKYTGKATTLTVKLPQYNLAKKVTLKSNGFLVVNFTLPPINP